MAKNFDHGYALLIAVDRNAVPNAALPDVAKDVAGLHDVLVHPNRCYAAGKVKVITGKDSTREGIMAGLDWLRDRLSADPGGEATAVFYFTGLVAMVPGAVGAVVSLFAMPLLGGIAGPVTKFVLDRLKGR